MNLSLPVGFSYFSMHVIPYDQSPNSVLSGMDNLDVLRDDLLGIRNTYYAQNNNNTILGWIGLNGLIQLNNSRMYVYKSSSPKLVRISGIETEIPFSINVASGFNRIPCPYPENTNLTRLSMDFSSGDYIRTKEGALAEYVELPSFNGWYSPSSSLDSIRPGEGYVLFTNRSGALTYT